MKIPYGKQEITQQDIEAVIEVLKSDFITQGSKVPEFEEAICGITGSKFAVAMNSATSALHLACKVLDVIPEDTVWTSPNSFVASANCALYLGAKVDFIDISKEDFNIDTNLLEEKLKQAKKVGKLPKVIIPVHFGGKSCDMKKIFSLSKEYNFKIIEDASHAIGGEYEGKKIGSCAYSDITIFSFHPVKIITTAEGGMALTNNPDLAKKMSLLRTHGITRNAEDFTGTLAKTSLCYYEQQDLGYNFRITDIQAALGVSQLSRLESFIEKRHQIANIYNQAFLKAGISFQKQNEYSKSAYHLYVITVQNKNEVITHLHKNGILANCHYIPIYLQPYYTKNFGFTEGYCLNAEAYYNTALSIPMYTGLKQNEIDYVIEKVLEVAKPL